MMNVSLARFKTIAVVSRNHEKPADYMELMNVDNHQINLQCRNSYLFDARNGRIERHPDLLIIDIDAFGIYETCYLVLIAKIFMSKTPVVVTTRSALPEITKSRYLHSFGVLDIVQLAGHSLTAVASFHTGNTN